MKKLFIFSLLCLSSASVKADGVAKHGMVLFGVKATYLYHLPMYHAPHDYEAVIEVRLPRDFRSELSKDALKNPKALYTIDPDAFILPDLKTTVNKFMAKVYRGHFEKPDPVALFEGKKIEIEVFKVIYFRKLQEKAAAPTDWNGFVMGSPSEPYLVHAIGPKPSFDQIVSFAPTQHGLLSGALKTQLSQPVKVKDAKPGQKLIIGKDSIDLLLDGKPVTVNLDKEIYYSEDDVGN